MASAFRRQIGLVRTGVTLAIVVVVAIASIGVALDAQQPADRGPASADATARQAAEALARRAADRLGSLQREAEALARQERTLLSELRKLEIDREIRIEQLSRVERDVADVQSKLAATATRTRALQGEADRQRPDIEARLVQLYKMGRAGYWRLLLDVKSLRDVGRAYGTASALGRIDRDRVEEHRRTVASLRAERAALEARAKELRALQVKARDGRAADRKSVV